MNNSQTILINRLAHKVKNDLTTMRLALFNLKHLLNTENADSLLRDQSNDFLSIIQSSLDQSSKTLSKILLATRSGDKYFSNINLIQILFDVVTRHPAHDKLHIKINNNEMQLRTDPESFRLFFELFFDLMVLASDRSDHLITVEFLDGQNGCLLFTGNFADNDSFNALMDNENKVLSNNPNESELALLKQLMRYLQISLDINPKAEELLEITMCFNQTFKEQG